MSERPTIGGFREKALNDPEVRAEYESLSAAFDMKRQMIALRKKAARCPQKQGRLRSIRLISPRIVATEIPQMAFQVPT